MDRLFVSAGDRSVQAAAKEKPRREAGFNAMFWLDRSDRAAAAVAPDETVGAAAAGANHDDRGRSDDDRWTDDDDTTATTIGNAAAVGPAMPIRSASAGCFSGREAGNGARKQDCCKKILHLFSLDFGPRCVAPQKTCSNDSAGRSLAEAASVVPHHSSAV